MQPEIDQREVQDKRRRIRKHRFARAALQNENKRKEKGRIVEATLSKIRAVSKSGGGASRNGAEGRRGSLARRRKNEEERRGE